MVGGGKARDVQLVGGHHERMSVVCAGGVQLQIIMFKKISSKIIKNRGMCFDFFEHKSGLPQCDSPITIAKL